MGTYLSCEENLHEYFVHAPGEIEGVPDAAQKARLLKGQNRYRIMKTGFGYRWRRIWDVETWSARSLPHHTPRSTCIRYGMVLALSSLWIATGLGWPEKALRCWNVEGLLSHPAGAIRFRPMLRTAAAVVVGSMVILFDSIFQGTGA